MFRSERLVVYDGYGRVIAFDQIGSPLSINVPDAIAMRFVSIIDPANDASVCLRLVGHN